MAKELGVKYNDKLWDIQMKILELAQKDPRMASYRRLYAESHYKNASEKMCSDRKIDDFVIALLEEFQVHAGKLQWTEAEFEALSTGGGARTTAEGMKSVKAVEKRLEQRKREEPLLKAEDDLQYAENILRMKKMDIVTRKEEKQRPAKELLVA